MTTAPASNASAPAPSAWVSALHTCGLSTYYLAILVVLLWIYGRGDVPTAPFIYQGF